MTVTKKTRAQSLTQMRSDLTFLRCWINPEHLKESSLLNYKEQYLNSKPNRVILDNFLLPNILGDVQRYITTQATFAIQHHTNHDRYLEKEVWEDRPEEDKFVRRWEYVPAKNQHGDSHLTNLVSRFIELLSSLSMHHYLNIIIEKKIKRDAGNPPKIFKLMPGDFIKPHMDGTPGRVLCMNLYLTKNWTEDQGGALYFEGSKNAKPLKIAPIPNRCVLFDPSAQGSKHWVEAMKEGSLPRYNLTYWYFD